MSLSGKLSLKELEHLVDELSKEHPNQRVIKDLFEKAEINYVKSPIEQLSLALSAIESFKINTPHPEQVTPL